MANETDQGLDDPPLEEVTVTATPVNWLVLGGVAAIMLYALATDTEREDDSAEV